MDIKKHWKWGLIVVAVVALGWFFYVSSDFNREGQERYIYEAMFRHELKTWYGPGKMNLSISKEPISDELMERLSDTKRPISTGVKWTFSVDSEGVLGERIEDAETGEPLVEYNIELIKWVDRSTVHVRSELYGGMLYGRWETFVLTKRGTGWVVSGHGFNVIVS